MRKIHRDRSTFGDSVGGSKFAVIPGGYLASKKAARRRKAALVGIAGVVLAGGGVLAAALYERETCAVAFAGDRSTSSRKTSLVAERIDDAIRVLNARDHCSSVVVTSIRAKTGQSVVWVGPLAAEGNFVQRKEQTEKNVERAEGKIREIFASAAGGATNYMATFHELEGQIAPLEVDNVEVWFFGDAVNTEPVDLTTADLSNEGIGRLVAQARLPRCDGWEVNFSSVNRRRTGGVRDDLALGIETFWREWVGACGGTLELYGTRVPANL